MPSIGVSGDEGTSSHFLQKLFPSFASKSGRPHHEAPHLPPRNPQNSSGKDSPRRSRVGSSKSVGTSSLFKMHEYPLIMGLAKSSHAKPPKRTSSVPRKRDLFFSTPQNSPKDVLESRGRPRSLRINSKEAIEDDLTCPICLEILYRPRELRCGHAFCLLCLQNYSNSCSRKFSCPSCRQTMELPKNGVAGLPRNEKLEKISEHFTRRQTFMTNCAKICLNCQSNHEIVECGHCCKGWCSLCKPTHDAEIKQELVSFRKQLEDTKDSLKWKTAENKVKLKKLEEKISEVIGVQISELENKKEKLTAEVQSIRERNMESALRKSDEIDETLSATQHDVSSVESGKQIQRLNQLIESASELTFPKGTFDCLTLSLSWSNDPKSSSSSKARFSNHEDDVHGWKETDDDDDSIMSKPHCGLYRTKSNTSKYKWVHNSCERPAGVAISPGTGLIYVTGSDACKVCIYDMSGKQLGSFGSRGREDGQFLCPTGIAFSQINNELYITDKWKHCISVFSLGGEFLRQIGNKGKGFGQFSSPEGIATDNLGNIYVADTCNDRVQVLDYDGVFLREVGVVSSENLGHGRLYTKREFSEPVGLAVSPDGSLIYVADSGNHRIKVFNGQNGERILVLGSRGHAKGQFESPESIAVDNEGYIVVGDSGNGRVQIFKPNGHFIRFLGVTSKRKGEFGWVSGVALTSNLEIVVTDFKNNSLAVF